MTTWRLTEDLDGAEFVHEVDVPADLEVLPVARDTLHRLLIGAGYAPLVPPRPGCTCQPGRRHSTGCPAT